MPVSFDDITGAVIGSRQGRTPPNAQTHVLGMMVRLGDLAALCGTPDAAPATTSTERAELQLVIGELAVALCGLGLAVDIDVGAAAAAVARKRCQTAATTAVRLQQKRDTLRPDDVASPLAPSAAARQQQPQQQEARKTTPPGGSRPPPLSGVMQSSSQPASTAVSPAQQQRQPPHQQQVPQQQPQQRHVYASDASLGVSDATASPPISGGRYSSYEAQQREQQHHQHHSHPRGGHDSEGEERGRWAATHAQHSPAATAPGPTDADLLMSPKTTRAFFPELDRVHALFAEGRLGRAAYDDLHMTYSVIDDHGEVIELIPGGRSKRVSYEEFPSYVRMAEPLRHGAPSSSSPARAQMQQQHLQMHTPPHQQQPPRGDDAGSLLSPHAGPAAPPPMEVPPGFVLKRIPVAGGAAPAHGHFSPDHFKGGLFSPAQEQQYVDVAYPTDALRSPVGPQGRGGSAFAEGGSVQAPLATRPAGGAAHLPLTQSEPRDSSPSAAGGPPPMNAGRVISKKEEDAFWRKVSIIEAREATGNGIAALELTLTMPKNGRLEPLTTNGEFLPVTAANAQDFLNLLQDQRAMQTGKLRRMDSVRALAMPQPASFNWKKETRLYGHDRRTNSNEQLMAPAPPQRSIFYVDFDQHAIGEVEPPALKRRAIPQFLPSSAHYMDFIMSSPESFKDVFAAATRDPSLLQRLQVTYCVPDPEALLSPHMVASLPQGSRPRCGLRDLIDNGKNTRVAPGDWSKYAALVARASQTLPPSVAIREADATAAARGTSQ